MEGTMTVQATGVAPSHPHTYTGTARLQAKIGGVHAAQASQPSALATTGCRSGAGSLLRVAVNQLLRIAAVS